MTQHGSGEVSDSNHGRDAGSVADELRRESERLRQLAEQLKAREAEEAEMRANYPRFKQFVYAALREKFERELPPLPEDKSLEELAADEGAQPLEEFVGDLDSVSEGPQSHAG